MQPTLCSPVKLPAHLNCNPTKSPRGCTGAGQSNHRLLAQGPDRLTDRRASVEFVRTHAFFPCLLTYPTYICRYLPYSTYVAEDGIHPGQACQPSPAQKIWGKEEGGLKEGIREGGASSIVFTRSSEPSVMPCPTSQHRSSSS